MLRPSGRETSPPPGGPASPSPREPCRSVRSPPGSARRPGEDAHLGHRAPSAVRRGGWPVPASALCWAVPAVSLEGELGVSPCAHSPCSAGPLLTLGSARVPGRAPLPPPFGSSFPLLPAPLARQNRTPQSWSPSNRSPLSCPGAKASPPVLGISLSEPCKVLAILLLEGAQLAFSCR